jgi:hypothetical protein
MRRAVMFGAVLCLALLYGSLVSKNWPIRMDTNFVLIGQTSPPPILSTISTTTGMQGSTVSLVITGSGFSSFAGLSFVNNGFPSVVAINVNVLTPNVMTADLAIPNGGASRTISIRVTSNGQNSTAVIPFDITPGPTCLVTLNGGNYTNGQDVIAQSVLISNPTTSPIPVEFKYWIGQPGTSLLAFASGGHDLSVVLPPGMAQEVGPISLGVVQPEYARGLYTFGCKFLNPVSGNVLTQTTRVFNLQ